MDDGAVGLVIRRLRHRAGLTQAALASRARVSDGTISRIERGHVGSTTLDTMRRIGSTLEVRLDLRLRWRGGELDRLLDRGHARLGEAVAAAISRRGGWAVRPEVSFSISGERGSIDLLAYQAARRALLVIELKTQLINLQDMLSTPDRKRRLGRRVGAELGWHADSVSTWLVILASRTNRRRVSEHRTLLRGALPTDGGRCDSGSGNLIRP